MKKASIQDIADSLQVSKSLVSFVLNGLGDEKGIKRETQQKVLKRARELNYKPNRMAQGLRSGKSNTIGLIVADISNKFYAKIARRVEEVASERNYNVLFCSSDEDPLKENRLIEMLRERQVDGLLISSTQKDTRTFTALKKEHFPFVLIDRHLPKLKTNYVGVDNFAGAKKATEMLIQNGYRNIALLKISPAHLSSVREREYGYREALKNYGIRFNGDLVKELDFENITSDAVSVLDELLSGSDPADALFTVNNSIAVACLERLNQLGLRIPEDIALLSFDDIELFRLVNPGITAIAQPVEDIGERAVNILLQQIEEAVNGEVNREILPVELIFRQSCRVLKPAFEWENQMKN
ncbi:MAG: LacI family DNA-binding transcriptional regulator [Bacteroidales bacterium]|nr:LacI family DNA-binding transcriptional regulator [Bacteroidales bacterium]